MTKQVERTERPGILDRVIVGLFFSSLLCGGTLFITFKIERAWAGLAQPKKDAVYLAFWLVMGTLAVIGVLSTAYHFWRQWQRDAIEIEAMRLERVGMNRAQLRQWYAQIEGPRFEHLPTDDHGLLGAVLDRVTGHFLNLDTGHVQSAKAERAGDPDLVQIAGRAKSMAALTGTSITARQVTQELIGGVQQDRELRFSPLMLDDMAGDDNEVIEP